MSLKIKRDKDLKKPVVCVDPSQDMLNIAMKKDGVIGVHATCEEFFSSPHEYSLDIVIMANCVHHFQNYDGIFSGLAKSMPSGGVCIIVIFSPDTLPYFKSAKENFIYFGGSKLEQLRKVLESNSLKLKMVSDSFPVEVDKTQWYNFISKRCDSGLWRFSDEELGKGIEELEERYSGTNKINFDLVLEGFIITKEIEV